jgi:ubiquinone/menaquinone biosynthesis C-methylase UbiE
MQLPFLPAHHPHAQEWKRRACTLPIIQKLLQQNNRQTVLEIGCGNGWFAHQLSNMVSCVEGIDIGKEELEQAARCFKKENLRFVCCSDLSLLKDKAYDAIIFNASIQYFDLSDSFWANVFQKLSLNGVVIIMDSPIYTDIDSQLAKQRSIQYFENMEEAAATQYYKHITWSTLPPNKLVYKPSKWKHWLRLLQPAFPIIMLDKCIKQADLK